jgi:hypothetical protein
MSTTTTGVKDDEKRFLQTIQSFRSDEETDNETGPNISSFDAGNSFTAKVLGAVSKFMKTKSNYRIKGFIKDSLLKLIKDTIEYDMRKRFNPKQLTPQAYQNFYKALVESRILFVSLSDLDFLELFYQWQKEAFPKFVWLNESSKQYNVILAENREERSSKSCFFEPTNQKHFHFTSGETNELSHKKQCHYLISLFVVESATKSY